MPSKQEDLLQIRYLLEVLIEGDSHPLHAAAIIQAQEYREKILKGYFTERKIEDPREIVDVVFWEDMK